MPATADELDRRRTRASAWFQDLRDDICSAFERLEDELPAASCEPRGDDPTIPAETAAAA
jgi:coproporphyrinogen III oxidase